LIRALLLATLLALLPLPAALAQGAPERAQKEAAAKKQLDTLRAQIKAIASEQRALEGERGEATKGLREADSRVSAAVRDLRSTEAGIATQEIELEALEAKKLELEAGLGEQREALATLVRSAYALGRHEQLKLLLAQDRMSDLARVLAYHRYFQADRQQRITGLMAELQELATVAQRILDRRQQLEAARVQQQSELATLESQRADRAGVLAELESRFKDRSARLAALGRDEQAVLKLLKQLQDAVADIPRQVDDNRPFASRRGQMARPLAGNTLASFGGRMPDGRNSDGLLIAGTAGAEVRAVAPGRVAYSDWLKGYGLLVIIDHGDGWMSLYAFNDALLKDVGDWVRGGEPLATVGSSGGQGRPALYFELRRNGEPQNPTPWLRP